MYHQYLNQATSALAYLSTDELKQLVEDESDEKLEERINDVLKSLDQEKEVLITDNRNLAEENVNKEPEIVERKGRISELSEQGKALCTSVQEKLAEFKSKKGDTSPETALALLQAAAAESEEKSEEIARKLQEKEIQIEDFIDQFSVARKEMHIRKLKAEKMVELMRQRSQQPTIPPFSRPGSGYPGSNFYPPPPGSVPYPGAFPAMPMPPNPMYRHF